MPQDTPLHKAANQGDVEAVKGILEAGEVDVNAPGAAERTALQRAVGGNHMEVAKILIEKGADVNKTDKAGRTPLHWACVGGHEEPVKLLLSKGVDMNAKTSGGMTPMHVVAEGQKVGVGNLLVERHKAIKEGKEKGTPIDFEIKDSDGKTPMQIAKEKKFGDICLMIKEERAVQPGEAGAGGCVIS